MKKALTTTVIILMTRIESLNLSVKYRSSKFRTKSVRIMLPSISMRTTSTK